MEELGYSMQAPVTAHEFQFAIEDGVSTAQNSDAHLGYRFIKTDQKFSFQMLKTGFVFNQVGEYESWDVLTSEARKMWSFYIALVGPLDLLSFHVWYINKLFIPEGRVLEDFIRVNPAIPPDLPQQITNHFMRIQIMVPSPPGTLIHHQAWIPQERPGFVTLCFDNDFVFPVVKSEAGSIWALIDSVRPVKDDFFERMLTDEMKDSFNG